MTTAIIATALPPIDAHSVDPDLPPDSPWKMALKMAERGFAVLALGRNSKTPHPTLAPNGFKNATTDRLTILEWARVAPDANYGIRTGEGVLVLDADCYAASRKADLLGVPVTLRVKTPRGEHIYFRTDVRFKNGQKIWGKSTPADLRGDGGYAVGPGSRVGGKTYRITQDANLSQAPEWLTKLAKKKDTDAGDVTFVRPTVPADTPVPGWVSRLLQDGSDGKNDRIHRVILGLVRIGWTDEQITAEIAASALATHGAFQRNPRRFMEQKLTSARRWVANNPAPQVTDPDAWQDAVLAFGPSGAVLQVTQVFARAAGESPTFPLSLRDVQSEIGGSLKQARVGFDWVMNSGLVEVVDRPTSKVKRRVFRLAAVFPEKGTQSFAPAFRPTTRANLCVPSPGMRDLFAGQRKLKTTYATFECIRTGKATTLEALMSVTGRKKSAIYEHLRRLREAELIRQTATGYAVVNGLKQACQVLAEKRGVTGYVARIAAIVAQERATRREQLAERDVDSEWERRSWEWKRSRAGNMLSGFAGTS